MSSEINGRLNGGDVGVVEVEVEEQSLVQVRPAWRHAEEEEEERSFCISLWREN